MSHLENQNPESPLSFEEARRQELDANYQTIPVKCTKCGEAYPPLVLMRARAVMNKVMQRRRINPGSPTPAYLPERGAPIWLKCPCGSTRVFMI